jgi:alpha-1,3-glucosyltransferase
MTLLLASFDGIMPYIRAWVGFANVLGCWTMFPLLKRDGLQIPYYVLTLLWMYLLGLPLASFAGYGASSPNNRSGIWTTVLHVPIYLAMIAWHVVEAFVPPPKDKPDLWTVANVLVGAAGFGLCYAWCLWSLIHRAYYATRIEIPKLKKLQ